MVAKGCLQFLFVGIGVCEESSTPFQLPSSKQVEK